MPEPLRPISVPRPSADGPDRLDSWKEIASWLSREVRTVQGWEKNEGLPVHRHIHSRQGSVYAFKSELDAWREGRRVSVEPPPVELPMPGPVVIQSAIQSANQSAIPAAPASPSRRILLALTIALAMVAVIGAWLLWQSRHTVQPGETISSIVVLPFLDLSPRHDQEYFSDGLTEDIIDALSRVPNLRVVARTSAFAFKGKANDVRQIGRQLDVNAVLEGSVRKDGDQLRITAQLNRVSDGTHLWSHTFDRQLRDIFSVQHEISQALASELRAGQVPDRRGTSDLEAWQHYQEARYFFNQQEPASYYKAIERYQRAINRDPRFVLAYAGLADSYAYLAETFSVAPKEVMPKARAAAETAVSLDDNSAEAHTSRGIVHLDYEWDRNAAQREFLRALQLNPGSAWAHHWYAHSLETQGRLEEATKEMRAALALDPLSVVFYWDLGNDLLMAQRNADALALIRRADELFPNFWILSWEKSEAYYAEHDMDSLHRELEKMQANPEMADSPPFMAIVGKVNAHEGRTAEARRTLDHLESLHKTQYVEPFMTVELAAALGDRERVKLWLQRLVEERSTLYLYLPLAAVYIDRSPELDAVIAKLKQ